MAKQQSQPGEGSWLLAEELLERGDPAFVDELRRIHDADRLGAFAPKWHTDQRPASRSLLLEYLNRPLNVFRHEPLVKRLFKLAEQAGDDQVMAYFLVLFDRSVRRVRRKKFHYDRLARERWEEETIRMPGGTTMLRPKSPGSQSNWNWLTPEHLKEWELGHRLFSVHTRHYLRRRAWRYFRKLGKQQPDRYVPAVTSALKLYEDGDVANGLALIDNWGLMHVLFHHSPALVAKVHGWTLAEGHRLAELAPAPIFEPLWQTAPKEMIGLLKEAHCRPVRQWAVQMIRRHQAEVLALLPLEEVLGWLGHEDPDVVMLAAEALRSAPGLEDLGVDRWLGLLETPNPQALEVLCGLMTSRLHPDRVTLEQAVRLACSRPLPVAQLGFTWLQSKKPTTEDECRPLLALVEAEAKPLRSGMIRWLRDVPGTSPHFQPGWVLSLLDSRHEDVREEGWTWFQQEERAREEVDLWRRLLESPFDDIRLRLVAELEKQVAQPRPQPIDDTTLDPDLLRFLWASVLLNMVRGGRTKPLVVRQLVRRVERRPQEAGQLLPILGVALRSIRGPEWRAGLAGVVQLVERNPELRTAVKEAFPELKYP